VFVRSLPNKKASQQARRLPSTIDRRQASTAGETSNRASAAPARSSFVVSSLVHIDQVQLAPPLWDNLSVAALLGVFLVPALYTRHMTLEQALAVGVGLAAAVGLRMLAHWRLRRLRE